MEHKPFQIYKAQIGIPESQASIKSKIETKIAAKFPGMNVEFISKPELAVVCLEMQGGTEEDQSALQRLSGQVDDELNEFR